VEAVEEGAQSTVGDRFSPPDLFFEDVVGDSPPFGFDEYADELTFFGTEFDRLVVTQEMLPIGMVTAPSPYLYLLILRGIV
jgi:hypothetical protein